MMNERSFVRAPWIEVADDIVWTVVEAYHWCGHPSFGYSVNRMRRESMAEAVAYLERLGFTVGAPA